MRAPTRSTLTTILLALAILLGGGTLTLTLVDGEPRIIIQERTVPAAPPAVAVDGPDRDTKRDDALPLDKVAQAELERGVTATDRTGDTHRELADPLREPADPSRTPPGHLEGPLAAQEFPGCRTRFVSNYSSRNGTRPRVVVWHQTVSRERGWSSQNGLTALANRRSSGVSWALLIGRSEGRCTYTVPLNMKAWTQSNANPFSIGIEVEAYGDEGSYVSGAGQRRLLAATREIGRRYGIPMRRAIVRNCRVIKPGIAEHYELGACGGGHVDVASTRWQRRPDQTELAGWQTTRLIQLAASGGVTATDLQTCRKLNWWRDAGRPHGKPETNAIRRRHALAARRVTCTTRGPVKR